MHPAVVTVLVVTWMAGVTTAVPGSGPEKFRDNMFKLAQMLEMNATWRSEFAKSARAEWEDIEASGANYQFKCVVRPSSTAPTSVHDLRPHDVNVVAALGDSITAGNGINAWTSVAVLREKRGESWSIGGDKSLQRGVHTITNVLRMFNPSIKGWSKGYGGETSSNAWLNQAVPGAKAEDMPDEVNRLIKKMRTDMRIDFENDWKIVTLLVGGNDLCDYCEDRPRYSPTMYGHHIRTALDTLHAQVPRLLVNLVPMMDVSPIPSIKTGPMCSVLHWTMCNCARNNMMRPELRPIQLKYYEQMQTLANSGRYDTRNDFTVVLQPFMVNLEFPRDSSGKYDESYIAPDCFHPNRKAHQGISFLLWNSMLTPVGEKPLSIDFENIINLDYKCPTQESPYIFTNKNSENVPQDSGYLSLLQQIISASNISRFQYNSVIPKVVSKAVPKIASKVVPKVTSKVSPKTLPKVVSKAMPKIASKVSPKVTSKVSPKTLAKIVSKAIPKIASKIAPKVTSKVSPKTLPKVVSKAMPKIASKVAPKVTSKVSPKTLAKVVSKAMPKIASKVAPKVTSKVPPKITSKVVPKTLPKVVSKVMHNKGANVVPKVVLKDAPKVISKQ